MTTLLQRRLLLLSGVGVAALIAWPRERADSQESLTFDAASVEFFQTKVKPLLEARCFECHGPDAKVMKGGLSLASRAAILRGGDSGAAIVPGKPDDSLLIKAINYVDFEMPPKSKLPEGEIAILTEWVKRGVPWSRADSVPTKADNSEAFPLQQRKASHWAWQPIKHYEPPSVAGSRRERRDSNTPSSRLALGESELHSWPADEIDKFVLSKLIENGLSPASTADRRTLIRRVYFDLIGLPPTAAEADEFVNDPAPTREALARVVDRLLDSPHFGERWARHWLDLVRYAETLGHEFDYPLHHAHQYRDYVIRALNADVPYDRFLVEHIAGDLLQSSPHAPREEPSTIQRTNKEGISEGHRHQPSEAPHAEREGYVARLHPTENFNESIVGTGFWYLGEDKHAPVDVKGEQAARIDNQLDVFSKAFLGLTVACARCHDHKFDAISTQDYYALSGFLQSSRRQTAYLDPGGKIDAAVAEFRRLLPIESEKLIERQRQNPREGLKATRDEDDFWFLYLLAAREVLYGKPKPSDAEASPDSLKTKRPISVVAKTASLNSEALTALVRALQSDDVKRSSHPWWLWHELSYLPVDAKVEQFVARKQELAERIKLEQQQADKSRETSQLFEDFSNVEFIDQQHPSHRTPNPFPEGPPGSTWFATGWAFGGGPLSQASVSVVSRVALLSGLANGSAENSPLAAESIVHSGLLAPRLRGVLRSTTFTITHPQVLYRIAGKNARVRLVIDGYQMMDFNGLLFGGVAFDVNTDGRWVWHRQASDLKNYIGHRAYIELIDDGDGWIACDEIRFTHGGPDPVDPPHVSHAATLANPSITSISGLVRVTTPNREPLGNPAATMSIINRQQELSRLETLARRWREINDSLPEPMRAVAIADGNAIDENVFIRGNHKNLGPEVPRRNLEALDGIDLPLVDRVEGSGRLQLALRLVDGKANPFVTRVAVNRVWHHLFGRGIVESVDNFGVLGKEPTHPELLDHLAESFRADGWSMKRLIRRLVLTSAYQMASFVVPPSGGALSANDKQAATPPKGGTTNAEELDPQNLWLHRMPIRRLEGEAIRDAMLRVSGRLDLKTYGPSVPVYLTPFMQGRGRPKDSGPLDGDGRRSIYTSVNRNFLSPMMLAFDTPIPFTAIGRRNVSNVPAQALILMNDPFVLDMARRWAERSLNEQADLSPVHRIEQLYLEAFTRSPTDAERDEAVSFLAEQSRSLNLSADAWPKHSQVWTDLCHVLFNVKEFVFVK